MKLDAPFDVCCTSCPYFLGSINELSQRREAAGCFSTSMERPLMSWYAYCLTEHQNQTNGTRTRRPFILEGIQGVNGATILSYPSGEFSVIVSEFDRSTANLDDKHVLEHARVVSVCFRQGTVLPFRFGTIFDSDDCLRQAVRSNRRALCESVARLKGKAEMHVKLLVRDGSLKQLQDVTVPDTVGGEYLSKLREKAMADRERQTKAKAISVQVHRLFNPLEEEISCKRVDTDGMLIDIAHLIDSKSIEKYQNRYARDEKQWKNCEMSVSGPWPPYHFMPGKLRTVA